MKRDLRTTIVKGVQDHDMNLINKAYNYLRYGKGLTYNGIYTVFNYYTSISKDEFEELMAELEELQYD